MKEHYPTNGLYIVSPYLRLTLTFPTIPQVEVRVHPRATARFETIRNLVRVYLTSSFERISLPSVLEGWEDVPELASSIERIVASESSCPSPILTIDEMALQIHIYQPSDTDSFEEFSTSSGSRNDDDQTMAASVCELPNRGWEGLWDSLIYADDIKMKLLDYIQATLVFSDANVDCWYYSIIASRPPPTTNIILQLIWCHGTAWCYCMARLVQAKHHYAVHSLRSSPSVFHIGEFGYLFIFPTQVNPGYQLPALPSPRDKLSFLIL